MRIFKFVLLILGISVLLSVSFVVGHYYRIPKLQQDVAILVLGKGGEGHTAPNLTDTIMVTNFSKSSQKINIVSLPRDIWVTAIRAKLNTAYHYGGFKMAGESVREVTGVMPNYTVVVDFSLFKDLVDAIGGISVRIENSFTDEKYPIAGLENDLCNGDELYKCRYETLQFNKGVQQMNGELALKFVRSRNAVGDEGTDIAREKRQQQVIDAIKEKLLSNEILLSPKTIEKLYTVFVTHIETDLDVDTMKILAKFAYESKFNVSFLSVPEEILQISQNDRRYDRQYVFIPKSGSWKELQEWVKQSI